MARFTPTAHILYICMAFFALSNQAFAQDELARLTEKFKAKKSTPLIQKMNSGKEQLILDNKDMKKAMKSLPKEGPRTGGGGNSCSLAIVKNTEALVKYVDQFDIEGLTSEEKEAFKSAVERAKFYSKDVIIIDGQRKEAANYFGQDKIVVSDRFCRYEMAEVSGRAMSLLMHEYLGLANVDDRKYQFSGRFLEAYSEMREQKTEVQYYLKDEVSKDLAGKPSCFKGAILKKGQQMEEDYGGRYTMRISGADITVADADETVYRYASKYCDEEVNGQRTCDSSNEFSYLVAARFETTTSGTFEIESIAFKVNKTVRNVVVVKDSAGYHAEEDEIISEKSTTTYTCTPLRTN